MTTPTEYLDIIDRFRNKRILIIGDLLMDVYLKGNSRRLCPEAPVPVVDIHKRITLPGGAANTVCNLKALGASVNFCTVIGEDEGGKEAVDLLKNHKVKTTAIVKDCQRKTITKCRVVSGSQVITRYDEGTETPLLKETERTLLSHIERLHPVCDGVVLSDYDKGIITPAVIEKLRVLQKRSPKFIAVDSKRLRFFSSLAPQYAKPNYEEAIGLLALPSQLHERSQQVMHHAKALYEAISASLITVTLDSEGSLIIENGKATDLIPAPRISRPHVAGAGDTYFAGFILSYLSGSGKKISAEIATAASSIAVEREDTSLCTTSDLKGYFNIHRKCIENVADLRQVCDVYHQAGRRIVFTNGCFDILHSGHVTYLLKARALGDVLIVGLNTDESIKRIKGNERPINNLEDRVHVLSGLSSVDHVIPFGQPSDDTPISLIRAARPHIFAKGGDYRKENLPEAATVEALGGAIVLLDLTPDHSTTRIISKIRRPGGQPMFGSD